MASATSERATSLPTDTVLSTPRSVRSTLLQVLTFCASLRITVVLFVLAIFLIFAGTLAQTQYGIWYLVDHYFRAWITKIDLNVFCQRIFFTGGWNLPGSIPFPGGKLIGTLMAINLLAAHGIRFRVQARGSRLAAGLVTLAAGCAMTLLIIIAGGRDAAADDPRQLEWSTLSTMIKATLGALWFVTLYGLVTLDRVRRIEWWLLAAMLSVLNGLIGWVFYQGSELVLSPASLRILWQLMQGGLASLLLLGACALLFYRRAGVVLLHAGILLLMVNELIVAGLHVESQMHIREGGTANYSYDIRTAELIVADTTDPDKDTVASIPESRLHDGAVIRGDELPLPKTFPWDVKIVEFMPNSRLMEVGPHASNRATTGPGLSTIAVPLAPSVGVDAQAVDADSAYVTLIDPQTSTEVGTYLLSALWDSPSRKQTPVIEHDGRTYELALRFQRHYKPYTMQLLDFNYERYPGTETPKDFSSTIRLIDEQHNVDRNVKIWMNNPLKYRGETFYQADWDKDDERGTVLQVVSNTGWMIPYVCCMMIGIGMAAQFIITLLRFLRRRETATVASPSPAIEPNGRFARWLPWLVVGCAMLVVARAAVPKHDDAGTAQLREFGKLPVVYKGRVKPLDTFARNSLRLLSGKQAYIDAQGAKQPAIRWYLDVVAQRPAALDHHVFRIENMEVIDSLGLERPEQRAVHDKHHKFLYSIRELIPALEELDKQSQQAFETNKDNRNLYQRKILELRSKINHYRFLMQAAGGVPVIEPDKVVSDLSMVLADQQVLSRQEPPAAVPPVTADSKWQPVSTAMLPAVVLNYLHDPDIRDQITSNEQLRQHLQANRAVALELVRLMEGGQENPYVRSWAKMLLYYSMAENAEKFNEALAAYQTTLDNTPPPNWDPRKAEFEVWFNHFAPFVQCAVLYVGVFLLAAAAWLGWSGPLNRAAFALLVFTFCLHTLALVARIYISGRPPVTNLYSSAVFIGWGVVLACILLEVVYRLGVGNIVAAVAGFATLLIAHFLAAGGDTFEVLRAVLDTQFWLATHVVCITLGYSATFLAGLLGLVYVLRGALTSSLNTDVAKDLSRMIYGSLCFATLLSLVGTVLGGLWADDSWGRFWGWDPKENGALIIVLWNALILHARWGGIVRQHGVAVLAIAGNIVTAWSWFGVNELQVGLHSYGFTEGTRLWLMLFVLSQLAVIVFGVFLPKIHRTSLSS